MKKRWFCSFILVGILLLLGNIAITIWANGNCPTKTDWLTLISGWISGIATLIVGIIAYLQNRSYTLNARKTEIKNNIKNEKIEILDICSKLTQFSRYMNLLGYKVENPPTQKSELNYKFGLDELREFLLENTTRFQLFDYIPNNIKNIVDKLLEKQMETYKEYMEVLNCNDDNQLSTLIDTINKNTLSWIGSIVKIRNDIIKELDDTIEELGKIQSITKVEEFIKCNKEKIQNARKDTDNLIKQMIEKRQKENTHE